MAASGVNIFCMLLHGRPVMEVFSGEYTRTWSMPAFFVTFAGMVYPTVRFFQTQVAGVLQVSVVGIAQVSAGRHIGARAYEVCVGIVLSPYIVEEIGRNEGVVGISVCTPRRASTGFRDTNSGCRCPGRDTETSNPKYRMLPVMPYDRLGSELPMIVRSPGASAVSLPVSPMNPSPSRSRILRVAGFPSAGKVACESR